MKTILLCISCAALALSAESPSLTDAQKLSLREAQINVITLQAEKNALESRLKSIDYDLLPKAQQALQDRVKAITPAGFTLQTDLTLRADLKAVEKK